MLVFGAMNASAQLTVYHNGNVNIGSEQPTSNVSLCWQCRIQRHRLSCIPWLAQSRIGLLQYWW